MAATQVLEILIRARNTAAKELQGAQGSVNKLNDTLKKHRAGLLAVSAATTGLGILSIKLASDLEEARAAAEQTFKSASGAVTEFANVQADAFNISRASAFEYTAQLGAIFNATGSSAEESARASVQFTKLAADLASFRNLGIEEALQKIRAGLVGEAEPLRQVGVLLSAARVEQAAYAAGIAEAGTALTEQQKVAARQLIILEDLKDAQGDVARTADSVANRTRDAQQQMADLGAEIGTILLPVAAEVLRHFADLVRWIRDLPAPAKTAIVVIGGIVAGLAAVGLAIPPIIAGVTTLGAVLNVALGGIPLLIGAVVTGIALLILNWDKAKEAIRKAVNIAIKIIEGFVNAHLAATDIVTGALDKIAGLWGGTVDRIRVDLGEWKAELADVAEAHEEAATEIEGSLGRIEMAEKSAAQVAQEVSDVFSRTAEQRAADEAKSAEVIRNIQAAANAEKLAAANAAIKARLDAEKAAAEELAENERELTRLHIEQQRARATAEGTDISARLDEARQIAGIPLDRIPGVSSETASLRRGLLGTSAETQRAYAERVARLRGLTGQDAQDFIDQSVGAYNRLAGTLGRDRALPLLPVDTPATGTAGRTQIAAAGINVTNVFNGPVSPDSAEQIEKAIQEAIRTGRLQGEGV